MENPDYLSVRIFPGFGARLNLLAGNCQVGERFVINSNPRHVDCEFV